MANKYGQKNEWKVGEKAWFQYQCHRGHDSSDAEAWYRSHQQIEIINASRELYSPAPSLNTLKKRSEEGMPRVYTVRFLDDFEWDVFEDELYVDPKYFEAGGAPPPAEEIAAARQSRGS